MKQPVVLLGAGGHGRVLLDILLQQSYEVLAISDPDYKKMLPLNNIPLMDDREALQYSPAEILLVNGLGSVGDTGKRRQVYESFKNRGYQFATLIHSSAVVSPRAGLGEGTQVMAGAIVQTGVTIENNSIINTKSTVEHDCRIGAHVHIASGAILCGGIEVGDGVHVGAGATVIQGISIGKDSIIGAGAVVISDLPEAVIAVGVPARIIKYREG